VRRPTPQNSVVKTSAVKMQAAETGKSGPALNSSGGVTLRNAAAKNLSVTGETKAKTNSTEELSTAGATLASRVVEELEHSIVSGALRPGDILASERVLAQQFGVSRTVIREALHHLKARSWVEYLPEGGAVVTVPKREQLSQSMTLLLRAGQWELPPSQVLEIRRVLEVEIAGLAALRRSEADMEAMESTLNIMRRFQGSQKEEEMEEIMQNDVAFHAHLARSCGNPLFCVLLDSVADILLSVRRIGMRDERSHRDAIYFHTQILDAVRRQNADEARLAMQQHLGESERTLKRAALKLAAKSS
jgi:GntR family transcriptional regulator, transcriptional repressor for pyruvate dehydrogenase complex